MGVWEQGLAGVWEQGLAGVREREVREPFNISLGDHLIKLMCSH